MKKIVYIAGVVMLMAGVAQAALVIGGATNNGNFDGTAIAANSTWLEAQGLDAGWKMNGNGWSTVGGVATKAANGNQGLGQAVSMPGDVGTDHLLNVGFDWTAASIGDSIIFDLFGWYDLGTIGAGDDFFKLNSVANSAGNLSGHASGINLINGGVQGNNTIPTASITLTATATGAQTYAGQFNTSAYAADLADLDYFGVRFRGPTAGGVTLDNVVVSTIPEPATLGLVAAFGGGVLFIRRFMQM